ncbi:MAG: septum formation initiator [Crocinitomicaceae bacterium]|jgi:cell division protein DivIC|nr:septum formation initiator [Crocinitomicaceae bacterium]
MKTFFSVLIHKLREFSLKRAYIFKNKYVLTAFVFVFYALFLDEIDVFDIIARKRTLNKIEEDIVDKEKKLYKVKYTLRRLHHTSELERYAREHKLFKKENEDIFIITYK